MKMILAITALLSLAQVACAQPNYQDAKTTADVTKPTPAACPLYFTSEDLCANYAWQKQPTEDDTGSLVVNFWKKANGEAVDPTLALKVLVWMPDMGHGSSPTTITKQATGSFLVDRVFFSMHGAWQLRFQLKNAQAVTDEQIVSVNF